MIVSCSRCGKTGFQRSRMRLTDFSRMIRLQLPVRCRFCKLRLYAPMTVALTAAPSDRRRKKFTAAPPAE